MGKYQTEREQQLDSRNKAIKTENKSLRELVSDWHGFALGNGLDQSCADYDEWLELERRMAEHGIEV